MEGIHISLHDKTITKYVELHTEFSPNDGEVPRGFDHLACGRARPESGSRARRDSAARRADERSVLSTFRGPWD